MRIRQIHLNNFRNYGGLDLEFGPSVNIIYGNNAMGKTNIIEAINVCSCLSSHRVVKDRDMITLNQNEYEIKMELQDEKDGSEMELFAGFYTEKSDLIPGKSAKRVLKQDGLEVKKISDYIGVCNTVTFAPEDMNIVKGAPSFRRKFLNLMISKVSPTYFNLISNYNRLLEQKNACLKSIKGSEYNDMELDYWDFTLADLSAEIIINRYRYFLILSEKAAAHHSFISGGEESLTLKYYTVTGCEDLIKAFLNENNELSSFIEHGPSAASEGHLKRSLSDHIYSKLKGARKIDVERGISSIGIQRDDIEITLNGVSMKLYSSQGQQRSAALSLKLAELEIISSVVSSSPILLLDDVFSELDLKRRVSLLSGIVDAQIFITCTDRTTVENELSSLIDRAGAGSSRFFHVEKGQVTPE